MDTDQPLTSVEAFMLALVEASSGLTADRSLAALSGASVVDDRDARGRDDGPGAPSLP